MVAANIASSLSVALIYHATSSLVWAVIAILASLTIHMLAQAVIFWMRETLHTLPTP